MLLARIYLSKPKKSTIQIYKLHGHVFTTTKSPQQDDQPVDNYRNISITSLGPLQRTFQNRDEN